jgi:hypothetical protein
MMNAVFLGVEGITGDEGSGQLVSGVLVKKALGDGQFAVVFLTTVGALGQGLARLMKTEGDDAAESSFGSKILAVQGKGFGKVVAVGSQPGVELTGKFDGADPVDDVVDRSVAGHGEETGFFAALGQSDGAALVLIKGAAFVPDGFDVVGSADQAVDDEGEHGAEGVAARFGITGVGESHEGFAQSPKFTTLERTTSPCGIAIGNRGLVRGRQETGAREVAEGCFFERADPEVFGFAKVLVEVPAVPFEAFGEAEGLPVGDFVEGAGVFFGVVETLGQEGLEAVMNLEFFAQVTQGKGQTLAGEVRATGSFDNVKTAQLDDEFEPVGTGDGIPADELITFFEAFCGAAPAEDGHEFGAAGVVVVAVDPLPKSVSGRAACFEVVTLVENVAEVVDLSFFGSCPDGELVASERRLGLQCFHDGTTIPGFVEMSRFIFLNLSQSGQRRFQKITLAMFLSSAGKIHPILEVATFHESSFPALSSTSRSIRFFGRPPQHHCRHDR